MATNSEPRRGWHFNGRERIWLATGLFALLAFGANLEQRTALRRTPMTDLGVFSCAAGAVRNGQDLYAITDWHGWHYQYPPALAILFTPLALAVPVSPPVLPAGVERTAANTPWGYGIAGHHRFYGLHAENARFFGIVAVWYVISVALIFFSTHALACALEGSGLKDPPPDEQRPRRRWWLLRTLPLLVCAGSLGTDLSRGQVDVLMLAAMSFAIYLAAAGREGTAGFWLSLSAAVKLFPVLLLIYPVWQQRWRMMIGAVAGIVLAIAIVPGVALGPTQSIQLYRSWVRVLAKPALGLGADTSRTRELTGMSGTDNQSLLSFIHNWRYHDLPRSQRPTVAPSVERYTAYAIGALILLGVILAIGTQRRDAPRHLLISTGLLMGVALIVNPVSHNEYFLLLLPLVTGLLDRGLQAPARPGFVPDGKAFFIVMAFMLTDLAARLPGIGPWLRELGVPLLSLTAMMAVGAMALRRQSQPQPASTEIATVSVPPIVPDLKPVEQFIVP